MSRFAFDLLFLGLHHSFKGTDINQLTHHMLRIKASFGYPFVGHSDVF